MKTMTLLAAGVALCLTLALPARAQTAPVSACDQRDKLVAHLEQKYGETVRATGMGNNGALFEVLVSDRGTWTLLLSAPSGYSCLKATGENWFTLPVPIPGQSS